MKTSSEYYTVNEVCALLGLCRPTVVKALKEGSIIGRKFGAQWRIDRSQFKKMKSAEELADNYNAAD